MKVINDTIHGSFEIDGVREDLLATTEFNKLSHIKQFGPLILYFPVHTIPVLSILGVSHLVAKGLSGSRPHERMTVEVAGMLHDVGHGPYSHTLEHILRAVVLITCILQRVSSQEIMRYFQMMSNILGKRRTVPEILESYESIHKR